MINSWEVQETNEMIEKENLDVRTITLGISLLDCIDSDLDRLNQNIYNKITTVAKDLVATGEKIEKSYTKEERKKFMEEGYALHRLLQEALKDNFVIEYEPLPDKEDV